MTPEERAFLERARVGRLATADGEGNPHAVPVCYALVGDPGESPGIATPVDEKPKSTRDLRRVRDVRANPRVALIVDRYAEDWSRLAWVQVRGRAELLDPGDAGHDRAVRALEARYDQYSDHALDERVAIRIEVDRTLSWGALDPGA
ncbi:TIGR03668 family PPOX class F420-dependent oxidoreductase [Halobacteriales archaeon QS_8_69_26]|nr:MAG: TIGR03668 family PPOX class F420-dependent oxidoreductase [Halobacteriales archaeon QS_8_69_26]